METKNKVIYALVACFVAAIIISMLVQYADCESSGKTFVRGLFWFECIEVK